MITVPLSQRVMKTSSNGNIFRVTGPLWGESTGHRWIPLTKASDAELWILFNLRLNNGWTNNLDVGDLRRNRAHYDVTVMSHPNSSLTWHQKRVLFRTMGSAYTRSGGLFATLGHVPKLIFVTFHVISSYLILCYMFCKKLDDGSASIMLRRHLIFKTNYTAVLPLWAHHPRIYNLTKTVGVYL